MIDWAKPIRTVEGKRELLGMEPLIFLFGYFYHLDGTPDKTQTYESPPLLENYTPKEPTE